jgi:outer membrane receptor for ferrienterochelin and colicins
VPIQYQPLMGSLSQLSQNMRFKPLVWCVAAVLSDGLPAILSGAETPSVSLSELKSMDVDQLTRLEVPTVFGASKREQKVSEAPSSVSIVTKDDIKMQGYRTLADLLQGVRGFYVTSDRDYGHIGVRGVNRPGDWGGRVLITIDGHSLNEPIFDSAFNQTDFILDMDLIERVEIIRGPGSVLYGNNAFLAVVNVVTRRGGGLNGPEVSGSYGSFDAYTGRLSYGNRFKNGAEVLVSGTYFDSAGNQRLFYPEYAAVNNGVAAHSDGDNFSSAFLSASYQDFSLQGAWVDRTKHVPSAPLGSVFADGRYKTIDERSYVDFRYQHEFEHDWSVMARAFYDYYRFDGTYPFDYADPVNPGVTLNSDYARADWAGTELQLSKTLFEKHRLTAGIEYKHDIALAQKNFDVSPPATYVDIMTTRDIVGVYVQDEYSILTNLIASAGVRYDYFSAFGSAANPRGSIIYSPVPETTLKLLYGEAYRAPNDFETSYNATGYKHTVTLHPETVRSFEFVYEQDLPARLRFTAVAFDEDIKNLVVQEADPADGLIFWNNLDSVTTRGVEFELEREWISGVRGRVSYTFADAHDAAGGTLSNSPKSVFKSQVSVPVWREKIFTSVELLATSDRLTARRAKAEGFAVVNATIFARELVKGLEVSASVYNLLDRKYGDPVSDDFAQETIPQDGRTFRVKLTYTF